MKTISLDRKLKAFAFAVSFCVASAFTLPAFADIGFMHPLGTLPAKTIQDVGQKFDSRYGAISFNAYHVLQTEAMSQENVPVYAVFAGEIYDIEETENEGLKIFVLHKNGSRSSYAYLDKKNIPALNASVNKGDVLGYTSPEFFHRLKYELIAENAYAIRHDFSSRGRNNQNFIYNQKNVGFAFYNADPLGATSSLSSGASTPQAQSGGFYVAPAGSGPIFNNNANDEQMVEDTLCPRAVKDALAASAEVKLLNMERMRGLTMQAPPNVKALSCFDGFVREMALSVATKGIFGKIINIFGPNGNSNQGFGTGCLGADFALNLAREYGLDRRRTDSQDPDDHRNIMYAGVAAQPWAQRNPNILKALYAPRTPVGGFFQPGVRAKKNTFGKFETINTHVMPNMPATIEAVISGEKFSIPRDFFNP